MILKIHFSYSQFDGFCHSECPRYGTLLRATNGMLKLLVARSGGRKQMANSGVIINRNRHWNLRLDSRISLCSLCDRLEFFITPICIECELHLIPFLCIPLVDFLTRIHKQSQTSLEFTACWIAWGTFLTLWPLTQILEITSLIAAVVLSISMDQQI